MVTRICAECPGRQCADGSRGAGRDTTAKTSPVDPARTGNLQLVWAGLTNVQETMHISIKTAGGARDDEKPGFQYCAAIENGAGRGVGLATTRAGRDGGLHLGKSYSGSIIRVRPSQNK